jgi:hypothetical protein
MNTRRWISGTLILLALALGTASVRQQRNLAGLRSELGELQTLAQQRQAAAAASRTKPASPVQPLSETEKLELIQLRAEVTRLQERRKELAAVKAENEKLQEHLASAGSGTEQASLPAGYVRRREARFVGAATPEAALQSFFWALEQRDTNALLQLLGPGVAEDFRRQLGQHGADDFWKAVHIPGYRIVEVEQKADDHVVLKVEILPGEPPDTMNLRWLEGGWRLSP